MKPLIPSNRENKRYLLLEGTDLKSSVTEAIKNFVGILGLADASLNWIESKKDKAIISINRESLEKVRASFALSEKRIIVKKVSGTIKGLGKPSSKNS